MTDELEKLRMIELAVEQSAHGIAIANPEGAIRFANPAWARMHGYDAHEVVGMDLKNFHGKEQPTDAAAAQDGTMKDRDAYAGEVSHVRKNGSAFPTWMTITALKDGNGQRVGLVSTTRDITLQKQAEEALRESEAKFKALFGGIPVPTYIWRRCGEDFELINYNDAADEITRGLVANLIGMTLSEMYPDEQDIWEDMNRSFAERTSVTRERLHRFRSTGKDKYLVVKYAYVPPDLVMVHAEDISERKRFEDALRESEQVLHEAQRIAVTGSWEIDVAKNQQELSPMMRDIYGFDRTTVTSKETFASVHPEDRPATVDAYQRALKGKSTALEYRIVRPNGEVRTVLTPGARLIRDDDGNPVRVIGVTQDITERKQTEAALLESEQRFRQLAENITDVFWLLDWTEQKIIYVSPAYEAIWGRPTKQLYDDPLDWVEAAHPEDSERILEAYFPAAVASFDEKYRIIRPDGEIRWVHHRGFPIKDESGRVYRMAGIAEDITKQKSAEEALRKSEERYRALYDDNPSMYFTVDAAGTVLAVNKFGAEQLGYTVDELVGRSVLDIFHEDDRSAVQGQLVACIQTPGRIAHWEYRKICKNGRVMYVEEAARSVHDADGRTVVLVVCENITDRREVEQALKDSERRFRTLTSLAPVGIFETDAQNQCLYVNERWCELAGITAEEAKGVAWPLVLHPDDQERISAEWRRATDAGREFAAEFRVSTSKGEVSWLFALALAMHDSDRKVTGYLGTITDITRLKDVEQSLRESEERYRFLYDDNPSMYFTLDMDGTVLSVNRFGAAQLGYEVEELIGNSVFDVLHEEDREPIRRQLQTCGEKLGAISHWELRKVCKNGRIIHVRETARAVKDRQGRTVALIVCEEIGG